MKTIDYSDINNQIGCGYCKEEKICKIRDSKINAAKLGCKHFKHFKEAEVEEILNYDFTK